MAPSLQQIEELALKMYKQQINSTMAKGYLTFLEICNYHWALTSNIMQALIQTLHPTASDPYVRHMTKAFDNQLQVVLLKRQQKILTITNLVEEMTLKASNIYDEFLEQNQPKYSQDIENQVISVAQAFRELATAARATAVKYFLNNCHFSSEQALMVVLEEREEDFLDEFKDKFGDFSETVILKTPADLAHAGITNSEGIRGKLRDSTNEASRIKMSNDECPQVENGRKTSTPENERFENKSDNLASNFSSLDRSESTIKASDLEEIRSKLNDGMPKIQEKPARQDSGLTSGFASMESSIVPPTLKEEETISRVLAIWKTIGNTTRRGSDNSTKAFMTIAPATKSSAKSSSRLVIFFGSTNVYARYFDEVNGKTGKSAQTIEPFIINGHQKVIGALARQISNQDTQNVLKLVRENPATVPDHKNLSAEEILAEFLKQIHLTLAAGDANIQEYIIIYPANFTHFQRRRLAIAADLAEFGHTIFISLHTFLAALQMTCDDKVNNSNTIMIHFSPKAFDVVIAHLDPDRPAISSYTGAEDLPNTGGFLKAHQYLIDYAATHGEDVPEKVQRAAGKFYKEIINTGLKASDLDWTHIDNILIIYDPPDFAVNLDSAFDSTEFSADITANEMDETEVLNAAISEITFEQAFEIQDIHPRNFGVIFNGEIVEFYQEKNTAVEEEEEVEFSLENVHLGLNRLQVGCHFENETYQFRVDKVDITDVIVNIKFHHVFLYSLTVKTPKGVDIEVDNVTFPYLSEIV